MFTRVCLFFLIVPSFMAAQTPPVPALPEDVTKAHEALERDRPEEAIAILQKLAAAAVPVKGAQHELGLAYYRTGKLVEAKEAFALAIQQDSADKESVQMEGL